MVADRSSVHSCDPVFLAVGAFGVNSLCRFRMAARIFVRSFLALCDPLLVCIRGYVSSCGLGFLASSPETPRKQFWHVSRIRATGERYTGRWNALNPMAPFFDLGNIRTL